MTQCFRSKDQGHVGRRSRDTLQGDQPYVSEGRRSGVLSNCAAVLPLKGLGRVWRFGWLGWFGEVGWFRNTRRTVEQRP